MRDGERVALRELLVALESGSRPKGGVKGIESGVPSLGGEHLDANGGFKLDRVRYVPLEFAASMRRGRIEVGDVLVVKDGATTGKVSLVRDSFPYKDAVVNEHVFLCRCDERVDPRYVFWYLFSAEGQSEILSDFRGAAQGGISQRFADLVRVPLRPIGEQRRIVAEVEKQFSRLDEAIANLKRVKANVKRYKAAVLKAAVEGRLVPTEAELARREGRNYETGEQLLRRLLNTRRNQWQGKGKYKEPAAPDTTTLPDPPEGWVWATYDAGGRVQLGRQRAPKYHSGPNMRPYLRVQNVFENRIDLGDVMEMDFPPEDFEKYKLSPGDLLLNEGQSPELLGRPALYRGELPGACFTNTLIRYRPFDGLLVEYALLLSRHYMHSGRFVDEGTITTNIAHLSAGRLAAVELPLPPFAEQRRIVAEVDRRLSIVREVEAEVDANLKRAQALRQAVLARAFSGSPPDGSGTTGPRAMATAGAA